MGKKSNTGFTLVELIVVIGLVAILASMAAPAFRTTILNNRLATQINDFVSSLQMARSEAIKTGANVVVCTSANGATCSGAPGWQQGWIVFVDTNGDNAVSAGERLINVGSALDGNNTLTGNANVATMVRFDSRGFSRGFNGTLAACDERGASFARGVVISNTGRVRRAVDSNDDGIEEDGAGNPLGCP